MNIGKFSGIVFFSSFTVRISKFAAEKSFLFQIKVVGRKIEETTPATYFIKVTHTLVKRD